MESTQSVDEISYIPFFHTKSLKPLKLCFTIKAHLKLGGHISRARWSHAVVATDQTTQFWAPQVSLCFSLPGACAICRIPCLTPGACKLPEFSSHTGAVHLLRSGWAYRRHDPTPALARPWIGSSPSLPPHSAFGVCSVEWRNECGG